ncbi:MAG: stage II sporulation protein R [Faecousia sp.]
MRKTMGRIGICLLVAVFFWCGTLISDRQRLRQELIRLHVVANSDSPQDQARKLQVRDAVINSIQKDLESIGDVETAKAYLQEKIPYIQQVATATLASLGCEDTVAVSLCREAFDTRFYETFSLPAGVYNALRIVIGEGRGENWWCVVFPGLCIPAASEGVENVAAVAGFPDALCQALTESDGYELRFGILDAMGKLETFFFEG